MRTKEHYGALDLFRLPAALFVIAIHTSPFASINANADFFLTRVLGRVAVPFFLIVTGHFVLGHFVTRHLVTGHFVTGHFALDECSASKDKLIAYLKNTALLYGISILIYIPIGIYAEHYKDLVFYDVIRMLVFDGTFYHLWYFPACMVGVILVYLLGRFMSLRLLTVTAGILYILGLLGDSYYGLIKDAPVIGTIYSNAFQIFSHTRNGLFFAPIFLLMGVWMSTYKDKSFKRSTLVGLSLSFLLMTAEAFLLRGLNFQRHDSMYLMLLPTMFFLYKLLMSFNIPPLPGMRSLCTWIYILHPAIIVVVRVIAKILHQTPFLVESSMIHYIFVVILTFLLAYIIACLLPNPVKSHKKRFLRDRAWIEISREALAWNVDFLKSRLPKDCVLMPAVKAEAYGHGAIIISKELNALGINAFCVASISEGVELRKNGVKGEILILGYTHPKQLDLLRQYRLTQTVVDYNYAALLNQYGKRLHVHIGVDTGMHRLGERSENIKLLCDIFEMKHLKIDGLFTHLAADDVMKPKECEFTNRQINTFYQLVEELDGMGYTCPKLHILSSYGVLNYPELAEDYARVGIALYGTLSTKEDTQNLSDSLSPVLSLKSRVASVRELYKNESAGYGMAFTAEHNMKIATITIGYADGLPRNLSNGIGEVLIRGQRVPIIGRVCMDQTIVDVSSIPDVKAGDIAVLIGTSGSQSISAADLAEQSNTITNEILCRLGNRLERVVV